MNQDFRQHYISIAAAALVAAMRPAKAKQEAAALDADDDYDRVETVPRKGHGHLDRSLVNNVLIAQLMQRQREVEAKQL
jgi:hypothetical protein